jgi:hypothetical protein
MIGSFILLIACLGGLVYLFYQIKQLLNEIDDNLHGDS